MAPDLKATAFAPQLDHPYLKRFDLIDAETDKYVGALVEFMHSTWEDIYAKRLPGLKLHVNSDPKGKNGARVIQLDMNLRYAPHVSIPGHVVEISRMGAKVSKEDFDVLVTHEWAVAYHRDPLDYEVGQWKRGIKKPLD